MSVQYHDPYNLKPRFMKPLRYATDSEKAAYMRDLKHKNLARCKNNPNENWLFCILKTTGLKWTRQSIWGYRIFDFWNSHLGIAVECNGPEHDPEYDSYRDEYNLRRSGIVVLHVRNKNEEDAAEAIRIILSAEDHQTRKRKMGIHGNTKKIRRSLVQAS